MTHIISKPLGEEFLLYDSDKDAVHVLNPTAKLIYQLVQKGMDIDAIGQAIKENFSIEDEADIKKDIQNNISEMEKMGLL